MSPYPNFKYAGSRRGAVLLLALCLLVILGILASVQAGILSGVLESGRAVEGHSVRQSLNRLLARLVEESLLEEHESAPEHRLGRRARLEHLIHSAELGDWSIVVERAPVDATLRFEAGFPYKGYLSREAPDRGLEAWLRPEQRAGLGHKWSAEMPSEYVLRVSPRVTAVVPAYRLRLEAGLFASGLFSRGQSTYRRPEDWDDKSGTGFGSPWSYRVRASQTEAYARCFSAAWLEDFVLRAGDGCLQPLDPVGPEPVLLKGFRRDAAGPVLGLSKAGVLSSTLGNKASLAVVIMRPGISGLYLDGAGTFVDQEPLFLCVVGEPGASAELRLSSCRRPVVLVAFGLRLRWSDPVEWPGALVLGPGAHFDEFHQPLQAAHVSLAESSEMPANVSAGLVWDGRLDDLSPAWYGAYVSPAREEAL